MRVATRQSERLGRARSLLYVKPMARSFFHSVKNSATTRFGSVGSFIGCKRLSFFMPMNRSRRCLDMDRFGHGHGGAGIDRAIPQAGVSASHGRTHVFFDNSMENVLVRIGGPAVPALLEVLSGPNSEMRVCAALVMGIMGRTSVEGDCLTRRALERLHGIFDVTDQSQAKLMMDFGDLFEDLGVGGRLAVPDLNELRKHANPWVRMWAAQALDRIIPRDRLPMESGRSR
jgi:hypothetical protein